MTWSVGWRGPVTDFYAEAVTVAGKRDVLTNPALDAVYEAVQQLVPLGVEQQVMVDAQGHEDHMKPGTGFFRINVTLLPKPSPLQQQLEDQRPVDLLEAPGPSPSSPQQPASSSGQPSS